MSNQPLRVAEQFGTLNIGVIDWYFRIYLMRSDPSEVIDRGELLHALQARVFVIVQEYLSDEFSYIRTGYIIAHFGRRGVTCSFWHWADWDGTWEHFCQAWYCYGRALPSMEVLDRIEPVFCQHELDIVMSEGKAFRDLIMSGYSKEELVEEYRRSTPLSVTV